MGKAGRQLHGVLQLTEGVSDRLGQGGKGQPSKASYCNCWLNNQLLMRLHAAALPCAEDPTRCFLSEVKGKGVWCLQLG